MLHAPPAPKRTPSLPGEAHLPIRMREGASKAPRLVMAEAQAAEAAPAGLRAHRLLARVRGMLGLSLARMGAWLGEGQGRDALSRQAICAFELGNKPVPLWVVKACAEELRDRLPAERPWGVRTWAELAEDIGLHALVYARVLQHQVGQGPAPVRATAQALNEAVDALFVPQLGGVRLP